MTDNPIELIHDVGAGGLSNAVPEAVAHSRRGARIELREIPNAEPGMSPLEIWCNEAQERYVLALKPGSAGALSGHRAARALSVRGRSARSPTTACCMVHDRQFGNDAVHMPIECCSASRRACAAMVDAACRWRGVELDCGALELREAIYRVLRLPAVADKTFPDHHRRSHGRRPDQPRSTGRSMAGAGGRCRGDAGRLQTTPARPWRSASARRSALLDAAGGRAPGGRRGDHQHAGGRYRRLRESRLSANWMAACGEAGEDAALYAAVRAVGEELCPALGIAIPVGKDSLSMKTVWQRRRPTQDAWWRRCR